jgi:hypothetical protein
MEIFEYEQYLMEQESYIENNKYLFIYTNLHPNECLVGDCVKRAIAMASGIDYKEVALELNRHKKITKTKVYNENKNWESYVKTKLQGTKLPQWRNVKVGEFAKQNPKGKFIIGIRKHLTAVVNGKIYDTWNCSFKAINKVWSIK